MRRVSVFLIVLLLAAAVGCGGGSSSSSTPPTSSAGSVTISPSSSSTAINTTVQFTATGAATTSGVSWSVNSIIGGNTTIGTINSAGLYTAPAVLPSPATVTVKATSLSDVTQFASASVTITSGTALSFTITPATASVYTGRTQQFTANFNTTVNTGVTWEVNSVVGGDATNGTINSAGVYTAPAAVPSNATVTITAISQADTTKTATATVTILLGTTITVTPNSATIPAGGQQAFTATVNNSPIAVTWTVNCDSTQPGGCGTISAAGVYTAPPTPPPGGVVSVTATSTNNSALPAGAAVTVQIANGSLSGQYAFSMSGKQGTTSYVEAGSITFDGAGNITGGVEDVNNGAASSLTITGGTYHVGADGRGSATVQTSGGSETWQLVLRDHARALLMRADAGATGAGALDLQDASTFATALKGAYTLQLSGATAGQSSSPAVAGSATADGAGLLTQGVLDVSTTASASTALPLTGTYVNASSAGRGTLVVTTALGVKSFAYYLIDADHARLVETDTTSALGGTLVRQPATTTSLATLAGIYGFVVSGSSGSGPLAFGGVITLDGSGTVAAGTGDSNVNGNWQNAATMAGSVVVTDAANGRAELSLSFNGQARKFAAYPEKGSALALVEIDGAGTAGGRALMQASSNFAVSFLGTYAARLVGTDFLNASAEVDSVGLLTPNGGSAFGGLFDVNAGGAISRNASVSGSYIASATSGRAAGTLQTSAASFTSAQAVFYLIDANRALFLETDGTRVLTGIMEKP